MRTLYPAFQITDPTESLRFFRALDYAEVGTVGGTPAGLTEAEFER